jgi:hypothetical protein
MTAQSHHSGLTHAGLATGPQAGYMPGFGNDFETEALTGALPQGMNPPQKVNYGLYAEQMSGTAFTAPAIRMNGRGVTGSVPRSNTRIALKRFIFPIGSRPRMCCQMSSRLANTVGIPCRTRAKN